MKALALSLSIVLALPATANGGTSLSDGASDAYRAKLAELASKRRPPGTEQFDAEQKNRRKRTEVSSGDSILLMEERWFRTSNTLEDMVMRDNSVGFVYPGSLVWTAPLRDGRIEPLQQLPMRPPVRIAFAGIQGVDLNFTHDGSFFDFQHKMQNSVKRLEKSTPRLQIKIEYGKSLESALLRAGLSAKYWSASLDASASRSTKEQRSFAVMSVDQVYYTAVADTPDGQGHLPLSLIDANEAVASYLLSSMNANGEPGYIRRVDYGRKVIISLSSRASEEDLRAAMRFSAGTGPFKIKAEAEAKARDVWSKTEVRAVVIGGQVTNGLIDALTGSFDGFLKSINAFLKETKNFTSEVGAAPVSFEVRFCSDNEGYSNYETVEFSGQIPIGSFAKGGELRKTANVELTSADARLLQQDWEVHSDDWTWIEVHYALAPTKDRRGVDLYVRMDVKECESNQSYRGKTHARTEKRIRVYNVPHNDRRLIKNVTSLKNSGTESSHFGGELHGWFTYGDGVVGALRDIKVQVDGRGRDDKRHQGLNAKIDFVVHMDRER